MASVGYIPGSWVLLRRSPPEVRSMLEGLSGVLIACAILLGSNFQLRPYKQHLES